MANVTPELIRDISVQAVEEFLNNKVPLSKGLAKQAAAHDLNAEQVKRAVESANNIAYLKVLQVAEDRTVEFPLAKFAEVMAAATIPENFQEKVAKVIGPENGPMIEKTASAAEPFEFSLKEKQLFLLKEAAANKEALDRIEQESIVMADTLVKAAKALGKDEAWMDKLASVTDQETFSRLSILVSGEVKPYRNIEGLFKSASLKEATAFSDLYKQAQALVREQRERSGLQKRAAQATNNVKSTVFQDAMGGATSAVKSTAKAINPPHVAGRAVGMAAAAPFKAVGAAGTAVRNSVQRNLNLNKIVNPTAKQTAKAVGTTAKDIARGAFRVGGALADAAFYDPGVDKTTGRSNDAWTALQRD